MNARSAPDPSAPRGVDPAARGTGLRPLSGGALVRREVLRRIYDGRYLPGRRLVEADLTREFGVSRSSVREGLSRLAAEGLITHTPHRGAVIRAVDRAEMLEILDVFGSLSRLVARSAAQGFDPERDGKAAEALHALLAAESDAKEPRFPRGDRLRFFRFMLDVGGNRELRRLVRQVHLHALVVKLMSRSHATVLQEYGAVLSAVEARDAKAAEAAMQVNFERNRAYIQALPPAAFLEADHALLLS